MKTPVHNHASVIIAYNGREILSNVYDNTYPREIWRGRINLIGGGQGKEDTSPFQLLKREIEEEFRIEKEQAKPYDKNFADVVGSGKGAPEVTSFASVEDINLVRAALLKDIKPYCDFLVSLPPYKTKPAFNIIFSAYQVHLSKEAFECARRNLTGGRSLVSEGFLRITDIRELEQGRMLPAWAAGVILSDFYNVNIPNPEGVQCIKLGQPKPSMQDYFKEYDYFVH